MSEARPLAWLNGGLVDREDAAPSVVSSTSHLGTSVFDGIMAYWNGTGHYVHEGSAHVARFLRGSHRMRLPLPFDQQALEAGIAELLAALPGETHYLRPIAFRRRPELYDVRDLSASADVAVLAVSAERDIDRPMRCCLSPWRRVSSSAIPVAWKVSGAYANSMLSQYDAYERGFDTAILLDDRGFISEASTANIFFVDGPTLVTPALRADVFPGITRDLVMGWAPSHGVEVVERDVGVGELAGFEGAFVCATLLEVRAIASIDDICYQTPDLPVFTDLLQRFRKVTHQGPGRRIDGQAGFPRHVQHPHNHLRS